MPQLGQVCVTAVRGGLVTGVLYSLRARGPSKAPFTTDTAARVEQKKGEARSAYRSRAMAPNSSGFDTTPWAMLNLLNLSGVEPSADPVERHPRLRIAEAKHSKGWHTLLFAFDLQHRHRLGSKARPGPPNGALARQHFAALGDPAQPRRDVH